MTIDPDYMLIGRVLRPHGVRGELRSQILTDVPQYFDVQQLFLGRRGQPVQRYEVVGVRFPKSDKVLLKLQGIDSRDTAELLRSALIYISREDEIPLEEGEFYLHQLIGMNVVTDEGKQLGQVMETIQTGANDVFVVRGPRGELLIPDTEEVVKTVDGEMRQITVHLIEGLLP